MTSRRKASERRRAPQRGVTLVELMVAMAIGLFVILAASIAFLAGKKLFNTDADVQAVQDSLRFARYVVQSVVRQAGYADYAPDRLADGVAAIASHVTLGHDAGIEDLDLVGATNATVKGTDSGVGIHDTDKVAQNDSLLVRYFGRSKADEEDTDDGTIIDCLGNAQKGPSATPTAADRVWSFFYVSVGGDGVPALYCKYRTDKGDFTAEQLARGVEKFKVVYGYDADGDSVPDAWIDAKGIDAKAQAAGSQANVEWRKVVAVRVGIVVRSDRPNGDLKQMAGTSYRLYPLGGEFKDVYFDPPDDGRFRSASTFTLMLRNVMKDPP